MGLNNNEQQANVSGRNNRIACRDIYELHLEHPHDCARCMQRMARAEKIFDRIIMALTAGAAALLVHVAVG